LNSHARRLREGVVLQKRLSFCLSIDIFGLGDLRVESCQVSKLLDRLPFNNTATPGISSHHSMDVLQRLISQPLSNPPRKRFSWSDVRPSHRRHRHERCRPALLLRSSTACTRHPVGLCENISSMPASPGRPCTLVGCSPHARQVSIILSGCVFAWYYF
jgi:hypothetical protein